MVVTAHVSLCLECRAQIVALEHFGGAVLEDLAQEAVNIDLKSCVLATLDQPSPAEPACAMRSEFFLSAVMASLMGQPPKWKSDDGGIRQCTLGDRSVGSLRLLYIPRGRAVPDHGHGWHELTMVPQGSLRNDFGGFAAGDVEVAAEDVQHVPVAGEGLTCICLAASGAPLRFRGRLPRLLQPVFCI